MWPGDATTEHKDHATFQAHMRVVASNGYYYMAQRNISDVLSNLVPAVCGLIGGPTVPTPTRPAVTTTSPTTVTTRSTTTAVPGKSYWNKRMSDVLPKDTWYCCHITLIR